MISSLPKAKLVEPTRPGKVALATYSCDYFPFYEDFLAATKREQAV
jgi:hypothetical protein